MLRPFLCFLLSLVFLPLIAQEIRCDDPPTALRELSVNAVRTTLTTGGDLWWDGSRPQYTVTKAFQPPEGNGPQAIFAGGLWIIGDDGNGTSMVRAMQYGRGANNFDFALGPLTNQGMPTNDCANWDRFFAITATEREEFLDLRANGSPISPSLVPVSILGWPARGNPYFPQVHNFDLPDQTDLAPFVDSDQNGIYDPTAGDYPLFLGDEAVWWVFSGMGPGRESNSPHKIPVEIQVMAYAFKSFTSAGVHRSTFYDYDLIHRGQDTIHNFRVGHFIDNNLGCSGNDRAGSKPDRDMFYVYNTADTEPEDCESGGPSYGTSSPVNVFRILDSEFPDSDNPEPGLSAYFVDSRPIDAPENVFFNYFTERWNDGTPYTRGGDGYNPGSNNETTRFSYDGSIVNGTPWTMCHENILGGSQRNIYYIGPQTLAPGARASFTLGITTVFDVPYDDGCPDIEMVCAPSDEVQEFYIDQRRAADLTTSSHSPEPINVHVSPNPVSDLMTIRLPNGVTPKRFSLYEATGRKAFTLEPARSEFTFRAADHRLSSGTYFYRLETNAGKVLTGRIVVILE